MAGGQDTGRDALLDGRRQVQQPERVADVRAGAADLAREFLVGSAEVIEQLLVGRRLFERVELLPVQVLDQRFPEHVVVLRLLDDGADLAQPGPLGGAPPPLAHDELVPAGAHGADDHGLQQADLPDGLGELIERVLVEAPPRLAGIGDDRGDGDLRVPGPDHLVQPGVGLRRARGDPAPARQQRRVTPPGRLTLR